ncbi:MAG: hypothetical protein DI624_04215 [Brevundimonas sp.]|uniref:hypothetical protein n=1 Tax=Brevundimonas sp. TaxID=1871086 RepID=UPI000DAF8E9B|nr:hypothetical protein [Brevundimonas sp.]PZT99884.1 MAG: hypothetical protein DI624_04215 [Brevundimonas sp.]
MSAHRFRSTELTRAMKAAFASGATDFDVTFDDHGRPIIKVRSTPANDTEQTALDELNAWKAEQGDAA